jgi:hypothetical protein
MARDARLLYSGLADEIADRPFAVLQRFDDVRRLCRLRAGDSKRFPPCETGGRGLRNNPMRAASAIATGTWYHVMSCDIT